MVSFYTKGRFANNAFIAMAAYCYAQKHNLKFHVPKESIAPNVWPSNFQHLSHPEWTDNAGIMEVNDGGHAYFELPFDETWRNLNIMIGTKSVESGYFQSHKYLQGYEKQIKKDFLGITGDRIYKHHVAVHWRLGDYRNYPDKHPIMTKEYFLRSIQLLEFLTGCIQLTYRWFSDEPNFVESFIEKYLPDKVCTVSRGRSDIKDFIEISSCEHSIVSNSSYSVLASILNLNKNKIVICPHESEYMGINNKHLDVSDLMPPDWIRMKQ